MDEKKPRGRNILTLKDPERIAINNRLGKTIRFLGEHVIPREFLEENYGDGNPLIALLDPDPKKEVTLIEAMSLGVFDRAMKGDIRALEFIRDTIGEKPATNIKVETEGATNLSALSAAQLDALLHMSDKKAPPVVDAELVDKPIIKEEPRPSDDNPFEEDTK